MRLIQLTDTHIDDDPEARLGGVDTRATLLRVLADIRHQPHNALIITGDVTMDSRGPAYRWLADTLADWPVPVHALPGNHDLRDAWHGATQFAQTDIEFDAGEWRCLLLDTRVAGQAHGFLGEARLETLDALLRRQPGQPVAVFMHHPPLAVGTPWLDAMALTDASEFWRVLTRYTTVRVVASGHVHQNFDHWRRDIRVVTTPASCVQFKPGAKQFALDRRAPGYRVFDFKHDGAFCTSVIRVPAEGSAGFAAS